MARIDADGSETGRQTGYVWLSLHPVLGICPGILFAFIRVICGELNWSGLNAIAGKHFRCRLPVIFPAAKISSPRRHNCHLRVTRFRRGIVSEVSLKIPQADTMVRYSAGVRETPCRTNTLIPHTFPPFRAALPTTHNLLEK